MKHERLGFRVVGGTDDFYGPGIHRRDMQLAFDEATIPTLRTRLDELTTGRVEIAADILDPTAQSRP